MTSVQRTPKEDLLVGGLQDWAYASWVLQSVRLTGEVDPVALRDRTLDLIAEVLDEALMVAGDIVTGEHVPWQLSTEDATRRIRQEWLDEWGEGVPTPGAIVWLANTATGDEIARAILARERATSV